ncbi:hypothetical protein [Shewanella gelidii]|uniref:Uncharacterized protein n=1 Tax=Shewanella gelidii TaxID=1642821 RepID=A0A917JTZ1_9GAMM|nr:hypothetical protein [Shewanella gelidii]MCL1098070.1 hypothetical protein [Shewanella gelidii]GGI85906.1 hypothetical protein GCM10009332_24030 [Shewanella gelidii]
MAFVNLMLDSSRSDAQKSEAKEIAWATLAPPCGNDLQLIQQDVVAGVAHLLCIDEEFYTVIRPEIAANGLELVIVAASGVNSVKHVSAIHAKAKADGFKSVRIHTKHPDAFLRMGRDLGYERAETIIRAEL